jgi:hypothetical protein
MARCRPQPSATAAQHLRVQRTACSACGRRLLMAHQARRTVRRLDGVWRLTLVLRHCRNARCRRYRLLCRPEEEGGWALPHGEFGFDVIALVGQLRYAQHRSIPEIHQELRLRGVEVAERTVTNLLARYEELLALRLTDPEQLRARFASHGQGHVILAIDGLKPDVGHEVLWVVRDCLSGEVLLARSLLSEAQEELLGLLNEMRDLLPVPVAGVDSDGQSGLRHAVAAVFPDVPHQLCQYHYLREAAKPIYEADRHAKTELKALVRDIRPVERMMENLLAGCRGAPPAYPVYIRELGVEECRLVQGYCLAVRSALTDDGQPPLCASGLRLHDRLRAIAASLQRAVASAQKGGLRGSRGLRGRLATGAWRSPSRRCCGRCSAA